MGTQRAGTNTLRNLHRIAEDANGGTGLFLLRRQMEIPSIK